MAVIDVIKARAKANKKHVLLPEGSEPRTLKASEIIVREGIADITLLGNEQEIREKAKELGVNLNGISIIDPETHKSLKEYSEQFYEMRKAKGLSLEEAHKQMKNPYFLPACTLRTA